MSTTYGDRPLRVTYTSGDSTGIAEFFDGSETGAAAIQLPKFSTTERDALTGAAGQLVYNETSNELQIYTGSSWVTVGKTDEAVQDIVGAMFTGNTETNISATYQDSDGTIDLVSTQLTTEEVQDIVGAMFTGNTETGISATYEDSDGTIDLAVTASVSEAFKTIAVSGQNSVVADSGTDTLTFAAGSNITLTTDNSTDTITIASTASGGGGGVTPEILMFL
jgi:hypothetical protein